MVREIVRDVIFLGQKSTDATIADNLSSPTCELFGMFLKIHIKVFYCNILISCCRSYVYIFKITSKFR